MRTDEDGKRRIGFLIFDDHPVRGQRAGYAGRYTQPAKHGIARQGSGIVVNRKRDARNSVIAPPLEGVLVDRMYHIGGKLSASVVPDPQVCQRSSYFVQAGGDDEWQYRNDGGSVKHHSILVVAHRTVVHRNP